LTLPEPLPAHVPPAVPVQVHVALVHAAGNPSTTATLGAFEGPALLATMVYVTDVPGTAVVAPSVLVIETSAPSATAPQHVIDPSVRTPQL
jgi:hypothetical protein